MSIFGTMADVDDLIKEVHDRKMRLIFDLVLNHTSEYVLRCKFKKERKKEYNYLLVNIHGLLSLDHLVRTRNVIGIYGEMVRLVVIVQIIGKVSSMAQLGNTTKKQISIIYIYFLVRCRMLIGNVQHYAKNYIK